MNNFTKKIFVMLFLVNAGTSPVWADNAIYIDQIGDGVNIDITQDGSGNKVGGSESDSTKMKLQGDNIIFSIDTVGSSNSIIGDIVGGGSDIDIDIAGSTNSINWNIDPTNTYGATDGNYTLDITGGNNELDLNVGTNDAASNGTFDWTIDGDFNTATIDIDVGSFSNIVDWIGDNNTLTYDADGYDGHEMSLTGDGNYWNITVDQQSTLQKDLLSIEVDGDGTSQTSADVCISQSDSGTATGCN